MNRAYERHNAKARQSSAGAHKKKKRAKVTNEAANEDPNALIVVPKSEAQKDLDRKEKLRQEVCFSTLLVINAPTYPFQADCTLRVESQPQEEEATRQVHCTYHTTFSR